MERLLDSGWSLVAIESRCSKVIIFKSLAGDGSKVPLRILAGPLLPKSIVALLRVSHDHVLSMIVVRGIMVHNIDGEADQRLGACIVSASSEFHEM